MGYTHGEVWTDELIEQKIWEVVNKLHLDHLPELTAEEIVDRLAKWKANHEKKEPEIETEWF